jgi:predicted DCC family thiol-disulfide oxidoreductase YuxK
MNVGTGNHRDEMSSSLSSPTRVYFDGACHLCSREIEHYRRLTPVRDLVWVDISAPTFSAEAEGLDPVRVNEVMHVRDAQGRLLEGVEAFFEIWQHFPRYQKWVPLAKLPGVYHALKVGYHCFARARPFLPKRRNAVCGTGQCSR